MALRGRGTSGRLPFGAVQKGNTGRFYAEISVRSERVQLGTYDTPEEASAVALAAKRRLRGLPPQEKTSLTGGTTNPSNVFVSVDFEEARP